MNRPPSRPDIPPRHSDNDKRRMMPSPPSAWIRELCATLQYVGRSKHKRDPISFGLPTFGGRRGDEMLCDEHAGFQPRDIAQAPTIPRRGVSAGLVGDVVKQGVPTIIWGVADTGWIFEARITNLVTHEYHGYPVRPGEAIAELVFRRFRAWAELEGGAADRRAAGACHMLYGFRDDL
jgi:hypothetical protein